MDLRRETLESFDGLELFSISLAANSAKAAVLFLHGIGENSSMYEAEMKLLKRDGYSIYSLDLRGHGRSPGGTNLWVSYEDTFEDLDIMIARIREREGPAVPIYIVGYDFGALLAASYIAAQNEKLDGVVLCGETPKAQMNLIERSFKGSISLMMPEHVVSLQNDLENKAPIRTMLEVERLIDEAKINSKKLNTPVLYLKWHRGKDVLDDFYSESQSQEKKMVSIESELRNNQRVETIEYINTWLNNRVKPRTSMFKCS